MSRRTSCRKITTNTGEYLMESIQVKAYAKINLGLNVLGRRQDGYHEVRMLMQTIRLFDKLTVKMTQTAGITLGRRTWYNDPVRW